MSHNIGEQIDFIKQSDPRINKIAKLEFVSEKKEKSAICSIAFNPDYIQAGKETIKDNFLAIGCEDGKARLFRLGSSGNILPFMDISGFDLKALKTAGLPSSEFDIEIGHKDAVTSVAFSTEGNLITGCADGLVRIFREGMDDMESTSADLGRIARGVSYVHDYVAACDSRGISIFNYDDANVQLKSVALQEACKDCSSVSFSPNARFVIAGDYNGKARLFEFKGDRLEKKLDKNFPSGINSIAFNRFGNHVAVGANDRYASIYTFDFARGLELACEQKMNGRASAVAFTHDGKYFAAASENKLKIFRVRYS